ncbi:nitric oxide dioxygenase [Niastella yeongjuensis]|uniref:Flavohemoprotein n=1 Tax=Niastella yeongjuensis TaxID=354355 RepID=A0A1V9DXY5_9BACT|nr:NO-inducible flavohemoprotein [Niastella yeongjuensis]OQP38624.1 nitric oxide dioxygenase [Niastella yeongjuensis]SEO39076.1 nitric oxide dioxygenase [Niastella yeongjuensis]
MTSEQKALVLATVPVLRENGVLLTKHFYNRMFTHHPELKNLFNMGNQKNDRQQTALALAVLAYAENIANPGVLMPVIDRIGHKHTSLDIRPEHYSIVGKHLLASIQEVLGDAATPAIIDAWTVAYNQLAQIMMGHEAGIYAQQTERTHGWTGWRPFLVKKKVAESAEITSFYLYPADGGKVAPHLPGQFISLRIFLPQLKLKQARQYSISSAPNNEYYRISVKKEKGVELHTDGLISNHLHEFVNEADQVDLTAPAGNFTLTEEMNAPVVLISGGVGLTPLMSMLHSLIEQNHAHPITWLHGCRNESVHAFKDQLTAIVADNPQVKQRVFYNQLSGQEKEAGILEGHLDINKVPELDLEADAHYFICGPTAFIQKQYKDLVAAGVNKQRIYFEEFGPQVLALN